MKKELLSDLQVGWKVMVGEYNLHWQEWEWNFTKIARVGIIADNVIRMGDWQWRGNAY